MAYLQMAVEKEVIFRNTALETKLRQLLDDTPVNRVIRQFYAIFRINDGGEVRSTIQCKTKSGEILTYEKEEELSLNNTDTISDYISSEITIYIGGTGIGTIEFQFE